MSNSCSESKETAAMPWNNLLLIPKKQPHIREIAVIKINDHEFLVAPDNHCAEGCALIYNSHLNAWNLFKNYKDFLSVSSHEIAFDPKLNRLYISSVDDSEHKWYFMEFGGIYNMPVLDNIAPLLVCVDGVVHGIGNFGESRTQHCICSTRISMNVLHILPFKCIVNSSLIYVQSKKILLLIGGCDRDFSNKVTKCDSVGIWRYRFQTNKWDKIKGISLDGCMQSVALTTDEKNVIIATQYKKCVYGTHPHIKSFKVLQRGAAVNDIYVLNIQDENKYILRKSKIKSPKMGYNNIVTQGAGIKDKMLVFGYIRREYKSVQFSQVEMLPTYLMECIGQYYNQDSLHWITEDNHFAISIRKVISCSE